MRLQRVASASITAYAALVLGAFLPAASLAQSRSASSGTSTGASFDELYRRGYQTSVGVKTLTARFTETTTSSLLARPLVAHGTLAVERPSRVVLRFSDPEQRVIVIDGDRMTTVWPSRSLHQVSNVASSQNRIQKYLASDSPEELRRQFQIEVRDGGERQGNYEITLIPKRRQIRDTLTRLELWVERTSFLLSAIRMTFATGDTKTMAFEDVGLNVTLAPGTFTVDR
jgi:outer membrane lipoprotein-sorting protein